MAYRHEHQSPSVISIGLPATLKACGKGLGGPTVHGWIQMLKQGTGTEVLPVPAERAKDAEAKATA